MYSALADRGASSPPAGSGAVAYNALSPTHGAASSQPPRPASGSSSSAQYAHLAAEPRGAVYAVPGALTAAGPRAQALYDDAYAPPDNGDSGLRLSLNPLAGRQASAASAIPAYEEVPTADYGSLDGGQQMYGGAGAYE